MLLEFANKVLQPVLLLVMPVLVCFAIAWVRKLLQVEQAKLSERQLYLLDCLISTGIWAAEQACKSGVIDAEYREDYVIQFIQGEANRYHLVIDVGQLAYRIKAAVGRQLNQDKLLKV